VIRRIPFAGSLNFRDIGGYPAGDGGWTRWGAVYRSDSLSFLTPGDLPAFDALGIKAIYDLRRSEEIAAHPGPREYVHIELANRDPLEDGKSAGLVTRRDGERWLLAEGLLGAPRWVMAQALGELDDTYDGIAGYLLGPGGMSPAALAALRTALLSQSPRVPGSADPKTGGTP
jgi:Tyrosine phosphatase family